MSKFSLWVGDEEIMQSDNVYRLMTEIDLNYEDYDDAIIVNNDENKVVYENQVK